jgi:hypothetical protein
LIKAAKRYLVDPSLAGAAVGLDPTAVLRDGDLLGRPIDTFAVAQIRPELELTARPPRLYHLRDMQGRHEFDLIAEIVAGDIIAIEIKATAAPSGQDARHLEWLHAELGTDSSPVPCCTPAPAGCASANASSPSPSAPRGGEDTATSGRGAR